MISSGHGTQTEDLDGDEGDDDDEGTSHPSWDRLTEAICPLDYHEAGLIIDDDSKSSYLDESADD